MVIGDESVWHVMSRQTGEHRGARLAREGPVSLDDANPMSWRLGRRVTDDAATLGEWHHPSGRVVTAFDVTRDTVVLRIRTPVGRQRFYGVAKLDFDDRLSADGGPNGEWTAVEPVELPA